MTENVLMFDISGGTGAGATLMAVRDALAQEIGKPLIPTIKGTTNTYNYIAHN